MNCDRLANVGDINPMVLVLSDPSARQATPEEDLTFLSNCRPPKEPRKYVWCPQI